MVVFARSASFETRRVTHYESRAGAMAQSVLTSDETRSHPHLVNETAQTYRCRFRRLLRGETPIYRLDILAVMCRQNQTRALKAPAKDVSES
jgi:hypothetical protein